MSKTINTELNDYISNCRIRLQRVLDTLGWSEENTLKDFNTNSVASSFEKVLKKPRSPIKATYPDSCITKNSVVLDSYQLQQLLESDTATAPNNFRELQANFSREQKLKIYEHVVQNTEKLDNIVVEKEVKGKISLGDILAQKERDDKRKKRRFRKSRPTHIEEVRCLLDIQMQALQQFMKNENETELRAENAKNKWQIEKHNYKERERTERYHRDRSKQHIYKRSLSRELSGERKKSSKIRKKEKRKRSRSSSNRRRKHKRSRSNEDHRNVKKKHKHRSRSKDRNSGRRNKERKRNGSRSSDKYRRSYSNISRDHQGYRSNHTKEACTIYNYDQDYSRERKNRIYCKGFNEKHDEKYLITEIVESNTIKQKGLVETTNTSNDKYEKATTNFEKDEFSTEYKICHN